MKSATWSPCSEQFRTSSTTYSSGVFHWFKPFNRGCSIHSSVFFQSLCDWLCLKIQPPKHFLWFENQPFTVSNLIFQFVPISRLLSLVKLVPKCNPDSTSPYFQSKKLHHVVVPHHLHATLPRIAESTTLGWMHWRYARRAAGWLGDGAAGWWMVGDGGCSS